MAAVVQHRQLLAQQHNPSRPDWVTNTEQTDQDDISIGCGALFLNYLAYQLNFSWPDIVNAGAPTLGQTAANLGVQNAFNGFAALLARHYPPGIPVSLPNDNPFPLSGGRGCLSALAALAGQAVK